MLKDGFLASNSFYMSFAHSNDVLERYFETFDKVIQKIGKILMQERNIIEYITTTCQSGFERLN